MVFTYIKVRVHIRIVLGWGFFAGFVAFYVNYFYYFALGWGKMYFGGRGGFIGSAYWSLDVEGVGTTSIMSSWVAGAVFPLISLSLDPSNLAFFMTLISLSAASSLLFRWMFSLIRQESLGCLQKLQVSEGYQLVVLQSGILHHQALLLPGLCDQTGLVGSWPGNRILLPPPPAEMLPVLLGCPGTPGLVLATGRFGWCTVLGALTIVGGFIRGDGVAKLGGGSLNLMGWF
jgi:hypothetical protein